MYAATDLPYPLPNPRPCGCQGIPAHAYGEPEPEKTGGGMSPAMKGVLAVVGAAGAILLLSALIPPEKQKPTVFGMVPQRKSRLP